jgi:hypothetical protein
LSPRDWVIVGQPHPGGGVVVLASQTVTDVRLREELRLHLDSYTHAPQGTSQDIMLTVRMRDYLKVEAPTYLEALAHLFAQWDPDSDQPALEPF